MLQIESSEVGGIEGIHSRSAGIHQPLETSPIYLWKFQKHFIMEDLLFII